MKTFTVSLFLFTIFFGSGIRKAHSQDSIVNIPDADFLAALIEVGVDTDEDGKISYAEAEAIIKMKVVYMIFRILQVLKFTEFSIYPIS